MSESLHLPDTCSPVILLHSPLCGWPSCVCVGCPCCCFHTAPEARACCPHWRPRGWANPLAMYQLTCVGSSPRDRGSPALPTLLHAHFVGACSHVQSLPLVGPYLQRLKNHLGTDFATGGSRPSVALMMVAECGGTVHVLQTVQKVCPNQACSLQGSRDVNCDSLAANDLGTGSGW